MKVVLFNYSLKGSSCLPRLMTLGITLRMDFCLSIVLTLIEIELFTWNVGVMLSLIVKNNA